MLNAVKHLCRTVGWTQTVRQRCFTAFSMTGVVAYTTNIVAYLSANCALVRRLNVLNVYCGPPRIPPPIPRP